MPGKGGTKIWVFFWEMTQLFYLSNLTLFTRRNIHPRRPLATLSDLFELSCTMYSVQACDNTVPLVVTYRDNNQEPTSMVSQPLS